MKDISIRLSGRSIVTAVKRFHLTLFIIFIAGILAGVVLLTNNVVLNPPKAGDTTGQDTPGGQQIISPLSGLNSLHTSSELNAAPQAPGGGKNPFIDE